MTQFLKPHGIRTSYLNIDSTMDLKWESSAHNPADVYLDLPNAIRTNKIWKISPHTVVIPRMFPNIYSPDTTLQWYQRAVVDIPTGVINQVLRTVAPNWTVTRSLTLPDGQYNVQTLLAAINVATGANEVWSFDPITSCFIVDVTPPTTPITWGLLTSPAPPAYPYANMTYIVEPLGSHLFDPLGLEKEASILSSLPLSHVLNPIDPNTFDNLDGSNLAGRNAFPLFDRTLQSYALWAANHYTSTPSNQPNLAGPVVIHVRISDLGDSSTVDAQTGTVQDIVTSLNIGDVDFGTFKSREIKDLDGEGIEYQQARNVSNFRVSLLDSRNRQLSLPRNFPFFMKLQMVHSLD